MFGLFVFLSIVVCREWLYPLNAYNILPNGVYGKFYLQVQMLSKPEPEFSNTSPQEWLGEGLTFWKNRTEVMPDTGEEVSQIQDLRGQTNDDIIPDWVKFVPSGDPFVETAHVPGHGAEDIKVVCLVFYANYVSFNPKHEEIRNVTFFPDSCVVLLWMDDHDDKMHDLQSPSSPHPNDDSDSAKPEEGESFITTGLIIFSVLAVCLATVAAVLYIYWSRIRAWYLYRFRPQYLPQAVEKTTENNVIELESMEFDRDA